MKSFMLILICLVPLADNNQLFRKKIWKHKWNAFYMGRRLLLVMQVLHREGLNRQLALNNIRFMYEASPHYEIGYLMGEIIERYKKMISHVRRRYEWKSAYIGDLIRRVQTIQHLYFEIYNLQRMMHEIEIKYKGTIEFQNIHSNIDMDDLAAQKQAEKFEMEKIAFKKKHELKRLKKLQKKFVKINNDWKKYQTPGMKKGKWPIEYGWDIGTDWL